MVDDDSNAPYTAAAIIVKHKGMYVRKYQYDIYLVFKDCTNIHIEKEIVINEILV